MAQQQLESFVNNSAVSFIVCDLQGTVKKVNSTFEQIFGWKEAEVIGKKLPIVPDQAFDNLDNLFVLSKQTVTHEAIRRRKDGSCFWASETISPLTDGAGRQTGFACISRDITYRKDFEKRLEENTQRYQSMIEHNSDLICTFDVEGRFLSANSVIDKLTGYCQDEILHKPFTDFLDVRYKADTSGFFVKTLAGEPQDFEVEIKRKTGELIDLHIKTIPIVVNERVEGLYAVAKDITERKRMEEALQESERRLRTLINALPDSVSFKDQEGRWLEANEYAIKLFGLDEDSYRGKNSMELARYCKQYPDTLYRCGASDRAAWETGSTVRFEETAIHPDGTVKYFDVRKVPVFDRKNRQKGLVVLARDVTERKKAEELYTKSEKLSVAGELAAGVAHEIRNPLTALKGFIQLLHSKIGGHEQYFQVMLTELDRINFIVNEFLFLAKPQAVHFRRKNLVPVLQDVIMLLETQAILNNVRILQKFEFDCLEIDCEENQLKQVFVNILKNAIESMPSGGDIRIEVGKLNEDRVVIRFKDGGVGIPPDRVPKLGEPFYTTKEKGTGLGLMVSYKIIEEHGGTIDFASEVNVGTTVKIQLPIPKAGDVQ